MNFYFLCGNIALGILIYVYRLLLSRAKLKSCIKYVLHCVNPIVSSTKIAEAFRKGKKKKKRKFKEGLMMQIFFFFFFGQQPCRLHI